MPNKLSQATQDSLAQSIVSGLNQSGGQGGQDTQQAPQGAQQAPQATGGPKGSQPQIPQQVTPEEVTAIEQGGDPIPLIKKLVGGDDDPQVDAILQELFSQLQGGLQGGPPQAPLNPGIGPVTGSQARGLAFGNPAVQGIINEQIRPGLNEFNQQQTQFGADVGNFRAAMQGAGGLAGDRAATQRQQLANEAANTRLETTRAATTARQKVTDELAERKFGLSERTEERREREGGEREESRLREFGLKQEIAGQRNAATLEKAQNARERLSMMEKEFDLKMQLGTGPVDNTTRNKIQALSSSATIAQEAIEEIMAMDAGIIFGKPGGIFENMIPDAISSTNMKRLRSILASATARMKNEIAGANFSPSERQALGPIFVEAGLSNESILIGLNELADNGITLGRSLIQGLEIAGKQPGAVAGIKAAFPVPNSEGRNVGDVNLDKQSTFRTRDGSNIVVTPNDDGTIEIKVVE